MSSNEHRIRTLERTVAELKQQLTDLCGRGELAYDTGRNAGVTGMIKVNPYLPESVAWGLYERGYQDGVAAIPVLSELPIDP